jgi:hypothetical protein
MNANLTPFPAYNFLMMGMAPIAAQNSKTQDQSTEGACVCVRVCVCVYVELVRCTRVRYCCLDLNFHRLILFILLQYAVECKFLQTI